MGLGNGAREPEVLEAVVLGDDSSRLDRHSTYGLNDPSNGPHSDAHLVSDSMDGKPCFAKPYDFLAIEDPARAADRIPRLRVVHWPRASRH